MSSFFNLATLAPVNGGLRIILEMHWFHSCSATEHPFHSQEQHLPTTLAHEKPPVTKSGPNRCFFNGLVGFLGGLDHFIFVFVAFQEFNLANILV